MKSGKDHIGVGCGAIIQNEAGHVLLMKRKPTIGETRTTAGMWSTPGGELNFGELTEDAVQREVKEELGVDAEIIKFIGLTDQILRHSGIHWHCAHFLCKIKHGEPRIMEPEKFDELGWFDPKDIPKNAGITHVIRPLFLLGLMSEEEYKERLETTPES